MTDPGDSRAGDAHHPVPPGGWAPPTGRQPPPPPSTPAGAAPPPPPAGYGQPIAPGYPATPPVYPATTAYAYGYGYVAPRTDGLAVASLVCGIASIVVCGLGVVLGVLGLVFGLVSMNRIRREPTRLTGRGLALAGAICGGVGLAGWAIYWVVVVVSLASGSS